MTPKLITLEGDPSKFISQSQFNSSTLDSRTGPLLQKVCPLAVPWLFEVRCFSFIGANQPSTNHLQPTCPSSFLANQELLLRLSITNLTEPNPSPKAPKIPKPCTARIGLCQLLYIQLACYVLYDAVTKRFLTKLIAQRLMAMSN